MRNLERLVGVALLVSACGGSPSGPDGKGPGETLDDRSATTAALSAARQRWQAQATRDYAFTFRRSCFCPTDITAPVRIQVAGGAIRSVTREDTGAAVPESEWSRYFTVDSLFAEIASALATAYEIRATYDSVRGYPREVYIDHVKLATDDEQRYQAADLEPGSAPR